MGCVVNGPGEAREADLGVASGNGKGQIFVRGEVIKTVRESEIVETLIEEAMRLAESMPAGRGRPRSACADHGRATARSGPSSAQTGSVRVLDRGRSAGGDPGAVAANPVENVFVASRIRVGGTGAAQPRLPGLGLRAGRRAAVAVPRRSNLVPVNADDAPIEAWAEFAGPQRMCASIIGPVRTRARSCGGGWASVGGPAWTQVRDVRPHQPVMSIEHRPHDRDGPSRRRVTLDQWDAYTDAAVKMYTEEVGVSPVQGNPAGYRFYVRQLITSGRAFGDLRQRTGCCSRPTSARSRAPSARFRASGSTRSCVGAGWPPQPWRRSSQLARRSCPPSPSTSTTTTSPPGRPTARVGFERGRRVRHSALLEPCT